MMVIFVNDHSLSLYMFQVEQLMALPDGVLKGLLQKFMDDEEKDVQKIRDK